MPGMFQDLRHGLRALASHPGLTIAAAISLGLAIGAQTSVYCLIDALFLRPPAGVTEAQRLVAMSALNHGVPDEDTIRYPDYRYYRDHNTTFTELASHFNSGVALADTERAEQLDAHVVSANYFSALGVSPHVGRFFLADEDVVPGRNPVVVLSHSFWQRRFDADPRSVGTVLKLSGSAFTIIGVGPSGFDGAKAGWPVDVFVPNMMAHIAFPGLDMLSRNSAHLDLIGRLKPGRTLQEARAEMGGLASQLEAAHAESRDSAGLSFSPVKGIHPEARPSAARFAQLLAATVTCLVVIACANLAGLLLARNTTRHKEIAMRLALGASRGRIVRQLLFESVLISICGGVVGLLFASWGNVLLASYYGTEIDGVQHSYALTIDRAAFLLTMVVATATGIAFGLLPACTGVAHGADSGAQEGRRLARLPAVTPGGRIPCRASLNLGRAGDRRRSLDSERSNAPFGSRFRCRPRCLLSNEAPPERLRSRESFKLFPQSAAPPRIAWRGGLRCIRPVSTGGSAWRCGGFSTRPGHISAGRSDPCAAASCHAWIFRDAGHSNRQGPGFRSPRFPIGPAICCRRSGPGCAAVA